MLVKAVRGLIVIIFLTTILGGVLIALTAVARLRGVTPDIYLFGQSKSLLAQISHPGTVACIDEFDDHECAHIDIIRPTETGYEITSHFSIAQMQLGFADDKRVVVSHNEVVLRDNQFCAVEGGEATFYIYQSPSGAAQVNTPVSNLKRASAQEFSDKMGFGAAGFDCMEYIETPTWLEEAGMIRRGFKQGGLTGLSRRVRLVSADAPITLSTK